MKQALFTFFSKFFDKEISSLKNEAISKYKSDDSKERKRCKRLELEMMLGKPVISISNEWENPTVGVAVDIIEITLAKNPMLLVKDYLTGEVVMPMGWIAPFTQQRLDAFLKLTPFEACSIIYKVSCGDSEFTKNKTGIRDDNEVILKKLSDSGFFEFVRNQVKDEA